MEKSSPVIGFTAYTEDELCDQYCLVLDKDLVQRGWVRSGIQLVLHSSDTAPS